MPVPVAETVMVAVLEVVPVFAVYVAVSVPFPFPDGVTVHQPASLWAAHELLEVTVKAVFPAAAVTYWLAGATLSVAAAPA